MKKLVLILSVIISKAVIYIREEKDGARATWWTDVSSAASVGGYSFKQVGVYNPLTTLLKMTKSILLYWSVILLSFSRHLLTLPSSLHLSSVPTPNPHHHHHHHLPPICPAAPYWSSPVIGWAVIWDGHWLMSANCFSFSLSLFLSSRGWWSHNASDKARQGPIAMECWPEYPLEPEQDVSRSVTRAPPPLGTPWSQDS